LNYFWENWFQNCFFNKTGSKTEPISINRFKNGTISNKPVYETGLPALVTRRYINFLLRTGTGTRTDGTT